MGNYELEKRTLQFSIDLLHVLKRVPKTVYNSRLIGQIVGSGTSVGANYREANGAESKKDFVHKIRLSLKEIKETLYWLDIFISIHPEKKFEFERLRKEAYELNLIFAKISISCNKN